MNLKCSAVAFGVACFALAVVADETVSAAWVRRVSWSTTQSVKYTAETAKQVEFPSDVMTPTFWFDCSDTNGWTFAEENGVLKALKVPSRVGSRYLTSDRNDPNFDSFSWKGWGYPQNANPNWVVSPTFTAPAAGLAGHGVLDFGAQKSKRGLVFDLWSPDEGCLASNVLANIGTVIAVYDSREGGGFFLGGGFKKNGTGYNWHRGGPSISYPFGTWDGTWYSEAAADLHFYNNAIVVNHAFDAVRYGGFRHDGLMTPSIIGGFRGDWETISMCPTDASQEATGIGLGDLRSNAGDTWSRRSGGMRIAEMIFFDGRLSNAAVEKVEAYLRTKWFCSPKGWNGNAVLPCVGTDSTTDAAKNGIDVEVAAGEGETLSVQTLWGGHFGSSFVKTGLGALAFGAAPNFNTPLELREGTLTFERRTVPADVPTNYWFRLDASREGLTVNGDGEVLWAENHGGHTFKGRTLRAVAVQARPKLRADALGVGKPVIDFGAASREGAFLQFTTNREDAASYEKLRLPGCCSVVALVGAQEGGGHLVDGKNFCRQDNFEVPSLAASMLSASSTYLSYTYYATNGVVYIDGLRSNPSRGYPTPGYHVVALTSPVMDENGCNGIGGRLGVLCGGMRIAEAIVYDRVLNDEELRDASAFLMDKWLGRVPGGYQAKTADGLADVQKVVANAGTVIDVPEGKTATVGRLEVRGAVRKTGKGTLNVFDLKDAGALLKVEEGAVRQVAAPNVSAQAELAKGASFHLDSSAAGSLETETVNGTNFVVRWNSLDYDNLAQSYAGYRPWLSTETALNGKPTVDFGAPGAGNPYMVFGRGLHSIRSVFMVWLSKKATSNFLLASSVGADNVSQANYDFHRNPNGGLFRNGLFSSICTNGVSVGRDKALPENDWILVEAHSLDDDTGGLSASALATDRDNGNGKGGALEKTRMGGQVLAEVVLYERELSEREKVATRNYLLQKWFPDSPLSDLPPAEAADTDVTLAVEAGEPVVETVAEDETFAASRLTGEGTLVKDGAGTLAVRDVTGFTGDVQVREGTLKLTGEAPTDDGLVENGLALRFDATCGLETITNAAGTVKLTKWRAADGEGWTAEPAIAWGDNRPRVIGNAQNGLPVVDLAVPTSTNVLQALRFKKDGAWARLYPFKSVMSVFGSQNGGGYFLAGGTNDVGVSDCNNWIRSFSGGARVSTKDDEILGGARDSMRWGGNWYKNGVHYPYGAPETKPHFSLSGDWDILMWNSRGTDHKGGAWGFGFDTRTLVTPWNASAAIWRATGQQRLAEVLFYDRALTDAERIRNENYLRRKWGLMDTRSAVANAAKVSLAADATLDLDGKDQYLGELGGAGSVVNGETNVLTLAAVRIDCAADGSLDVGAALKFDAGFKVVFENFPADGAARTWTLARALSVIDRPLNRDLVIEGATGLEGYRPKLSVAADGTVTLGFVGNGFLLLVK